MKQTIRAREHGSSFEFDGHALRWCKRRAQGIEAVELADEMQGRTVEVPPMRSATVMCAVFFFACSGTQTGSEPMSSDEALTAVNESSSSAEAASLVSASIDLSSKFTLGAHVSDALGSIAAFVTAQMPCATAAIGGNTLAIDYGANAGSCVFDGLALSGVQTLTMNASGDSSAEIDEAWAKVDDGNVRIGGAAHVTWTTTSRRIQSTITWARASDGMSGQGSSDVTQAVLTDGTSSDAIGFDETGTRSWTDASGSWSISIEHAAQRFADPLPQAGAYVLFTASGRNAVVTFSRVDDTTLGAQIQAGNSSYTFDVTASGKVTLY